MRRKTDVIVNHWLTNLITLKSETDDYTLENLVKIQFRILRGLDATEFMDEAITAVYYFANQGYINIVTENDPPFTYWGIQKNNFHFSFTNKFDELIEQIKKEQSQLPTTPLSGLPSIHTLIVNSGSIGNIAGQDINTIKSEKGDNFINSPQIHYHSEKKRKNKQTVRLQLKSFLDGNLQVANALMKNMGMPILERFDIYKAEQLQEEILIEFPTIYTQFHDLRLAITKGNTLIETALDQYNNTAQRLGFHAPGMYENVGYTLRVLKMEVEKIVKLSMDILSNDGIVSEDELHT